MSLFKRILRVYKDDGVFALLESIRHYIAKDIGRYKIDPFFRRHHYIGMMLTPLLGFIMYRKVMIKGRTCYKNYRIFGKNIFGHKFFYFYHFDAVRHVDKAEVFKNKYFNHDSVNLNSDDIVIEVGAARGVTTQVAADKASEVYALEPDPRIYPCLVNNIEAENIEVFQYAAWNESKVIEFNLGEVGASSMIYWDKKHDNLKTSVKALSLESFVKEANIDRVDLIKIEAEGAEPEVVEGIGNLNIPKVIVNCSPERSGQSPRKEVTQMLEEMGYDIVDVEENIVYASK